MYSTEPRDPEYCCNYISGSSCVSDSSDYFDEDGRTPKSILVGFIIGCILFFLVYALSCVDKSLRLSSDAWKTTFIFVIPSIIIYSAMAILFLTANGYVIGTAWFYILYGTKNTEVACYIAWFAAGTPLYGNFGIFITAAIAGMLLYVGVVLRPRWAEKEGELFAEVILQLPVTTRSHEELGNVIENKLKFLYIDAIDGLRGLMIAKGMSNDRRITTPFKLDLADKYGTGQGTINVDEKAALNAIQKLGLETSAGIVHVEPIADDNAFDYCKLPSLQANSYDLLLSCAYFEVSKMLGTDRMMLYDVMGGGNPYSKKVKACRILNTFRELHRILKNDGLFLLKFRGGSNLSEVERYRRYLSAAGFKSRCISKSQDGSALFFGMIKLPAQYSYMIIAKKNNSLDFLDVFVPSTLNIENFNNVYKEFIREKVFLTGDHSNVQQQLGWYDKIATRAHKMIIFSVALVSCIIFFIIALVVLLIFFDDMEVPKDAGTSNYFVWNMLGFVTNTPGNLFVILLPALYLALMRNVELTLRGAVNISVTTCMFGYFFSVIFSFPSWVINVLVSFYIFQEGLGLDASSFANRFLTALTFGLLFSGISKFFKQRQTVVKVLPDEIPIAELPAICGYDTVLMSDDKGNAIIGYEHSRTVDQTMIFNTINRNSRNDGL